MTQFYALYGKRFLDLIASSTLLLIFSPIWLGLVLFVYASMGAPVFFRQQRVGQDERIFRLWKFRTMTDARDSNGMLLPDGERLTAFGRFLRRWSLDELPQLINVLRGDMSLIGPRPLLVRYLPRYNDRQRRRHHVRPGITGWAQVNGRNRLGWPERLECDVEYVERVSFLYDLKIIALTFNRALNKSDTAPDAGDTISEFWGTMSPPDGDHRSRPSEETVLH